MSELATIRTAVVAQMAAVPDIGKVHNRERYAKDESKFRDQYLHTLTDGDKQIRGWWLRRMSTARTVISTGAALEVHTWQWRGYMAFSDDKASELAFDELIEAYRAANADDPTLGGVCEQNPLDEGDGMDGVQVLDAGPVNFCGALCHSAVLQLKTWSYVNL